MDDDDQYSYIKVDLDSVKDCFQVFYNLRRCIKLLNKLLHKIRGLLVHIDAAGHHLVSLLLLSLANVEDVVDRVNDLADLLVVLILPIDLILKILL